MLRLSAVLVLAAFLAPPARAADDAVKEYKSELVKVLTRQKVYETKEMDRELRVAYATYIQPWLDRGKPNAPKVIEYDFSGYRKVFETWEGFEKERGELAIRFAQSGGKETAKRLLGDLLDAIEEGMKQDQAISRSKPKSYSVHDQPPAIYRFGASRREAALVEAIGVLAKDAEALAYLTGEGLERVDKFDKVSRGDLARIALLDGLSRTPGKASDTLLAAAADGESRRLRIVGLEGLARAGADRDAVRERLLGAAGTDACFAVRVAAIEALGGILKDPRAIPALAQALEKEIEGENGILRMHLRRALAAIAGKDLGDAPDSWKAWYQRNREAIEGGTWKPGEDEGTAPGDDEKDSVAFYDIRTLSKRFLVFVDASDTLIKPVDIELARTKNFFQWAAMSEKDRNYLSQYGLLRRETLKMVQALRADARFNLVVMNGSGQLNPFWAHGLAPAEEAVKKRVEPFLDEVVVGGWAPQIEGIWEGYRMAGADPFGFEVPDRPAADTMFLLSDGVPSGGEIMYGPALVDEVRRRHRFFRIPIHTIRIDDYKDTAEEVMKGVAEVTGGTWVWRTKP